MQENDISIIKIRASLLHLPRKSHFILEQRGLTCDFISFSFDAPRLFISYVAYYQPSSQ